MEFTFKILPIYRPLHNFKIYNSRIFVKVWLVVTQKHNLLETMSKCRENPHGIPRERWTFADEQKNYLSISFFLVIGLGLTLRTTWSLWSPKMIILFISHTAHTQNEKNIYLYFFLLSFDIYLPFFNTSHHLVVFTW